VSELLVAKSTVGEGLVVGGVCSDGERVAVDSEGIGLGREVEVSLGLEVEGNTRREKEKGGKGFDASFGFYEGRRLVLED